MTVILETDRLRLRRPIDADWSAFRDFYMSDAAAFVGGPLPISDAFRWFSAMAGHWALKGFGWFWAEASDRVVAVTGPHFPPNHADLEIGWITYPAAQGQGYGFEAAGAARDWTKKTLTPARLVSYIDPRNTASRALATKLRAVTDGTRAEHDAGCEVWVHP